MVTINGKQKMTDWKIIDVSLDLCNSKPSNRRTSGSFSKEEVLQLFTINKRKVPWLWESSSYKFCAFCMCVQHNWKAENR